MSSLVEMPEADKSVVFFRLALLDLWSLTPTSAIYRQGGIDCSGERYLWRWHLYDALGNILGIQRQSGRLGYATRQAFTRGALQRRKFAGQTYIDRLDRSGERQPMFMSLNVRPRKRCGNLANSVNVGFDSKWSLVVVKRHCAGVAIISFQWGMQVLDVEGVDRVDDVKRRCLLP